MCTFSHGQDQGKVRKKHSVTQADPVDGMGTVVEILHNRTVNTYWKLALGSHSWII